MGNKQHNLNIISCLETPQVSLNNIWHMIIYFKNKNGDASMGLYHSFSLSFFSLTYTLGQTHTFNRSFVVFLPAAWGIEPVHY